MLLERLVELSEKKIVVERNQFLQVKGIVDTNIYFVQSGSLKLFMMDEVEERIIRFGYKNNLIVALDSYLTGKPTQYYLQAIKKTTVEVIPKKRMDELLKKPQNSILWQTILEDLVVQQLEREIDLLTTSPKERYLRVLKRSPQLFQEIPNKHIANYLRMSAETLSRLKNLDLNQDL